RDGVELRLHDRGPQRILAGKLRRIERRADEKDTWNAVRSAGGLSAAARGRWAQPIASAPKKTASARQPLRGLDDIQGGAANVHGVAPHHDVEPPRLDYALHVGAVVGQMLRPDLERDGAGFPRLQRDAPEPARLLH